MATADRDLIADAPLLAAWLSYQRRPGAPFVIPGHKGLAGLLWTELGSVLAGDVPLYGGLDTVKQSGAVLADAQDRAARLWGGHWCRFATGGSTHANQALALAVGRPGDTVLVSRSAHRSTVLGLVLAGLLPVWLPVTVDGRFGIPAGVAAADLAAALATHPRARAVFLVEPSYLGTVGDLATLVALGHGAGMPVLVDQAWGAHFGFHPRLPGHALAAGADAMVISAHKTLPAYSQASVLVARTDWLDPHRLERAFQAGHTTSPAGSILASIDAARALLAARGATLFDPLLRAVDAARDELRTVPGILAPGPDDFPPGRFDPAKLVVLLAGTGASGIEVEQDLLDADIPVEMADRDTVVPVATLADSADRIGRLVAALIAAVHRRRGTPRPLVPAVQWRAAGARALTPREAFFAPHEAVPGHTAVGRICAEVIAPYPPGVPVLVPGEIVTREILDGLRAARAAGTRIAYAADPTLQTVLVVSPR
jgi:arginine decarboxylase